MEFSVVVPTHDTHLQCFAEVADSIACALQDLGHHALVERAVQPGTRGIFCGLPLGKLPADAIIYNGEQVNRDSIWGARGLARLYQGHTVWDYSSINAARYPEHGLPVPQVVRPGYYRFDGRGENTTKSFDVAFVGSSNPRREQLLAELQGRGLTLLRVPFGVYGEARDDLLLGARLCINIHFYETAIFESVRCSHLASLGIPVLSEVSAGDEGTLYGMGGVPYRMLADFAETLICNPDTRRTQRDLQLTCLRALPMKEQVGAALEALDHKPVTHSIPAATELAELPPITLCMIVKDEAHIIERCLASVKPLLKRWCIVDTGSTDGTQDVIRKHLEGIPGTLHECSWKEYDGSRNEAIDLARQECGGEGWLLLIDADEVLQVRGQLQLPGSYDCYDGWVTRCDMCQPWARPVLLRASKPWYFVLPRHEGLYCREWAPTAPAPCDALLLLSSKEGNRARENEYDRFMRDAKVLEEWMVRNPGHFAAARAQYYIGMSYLWASTGKSPPDRGAAQQAIVQLTKRAKMGGYDAEVHSALYWAADAMIKAGYPWERIQGAYLEAYNQRPSRAEALYEVGLYHRYQGHYALAELFLRKAASIPMTGDAFHDVNYSIYGWRAKEDLGVALSWLGNWAEARDLYRQVLAYERLPEDQRKRIQDNLEDAIKHAPD